jgi:hypothetical protein
LNRKLESNFCSPAPLSKAAMSALMSAEDFTPEFMTDLKKTMSKPILKVRYFSASRL